MPTEDRRVGKLLPTPVTPVGTVCYTIEIPNAVQYRAAFLGQLDILGRWTTWDHQRSVNECVECEEAAQLWRNALYNATWSDDCEGTMSCLDVANCIENDAATQAAIDAAVIGSNAVNSYFNTTNNIGVPMLPAAAAASLTSAAACDDDALFGSITSIVNQLNTNNVDFLEQLEIESNTIERSRDLIAAIPLFETLPVDEIVGYLDTLMSDIKENYDAALTTALIDTYRCDLFCAAKERVECDVSFDTLIAYFEDRLGASFEPETIFLNFVEYFTVGSWSGTQIVDVMMLGQLAVWRAASSFLGLSLRTLQVVGALGANDPDPDWMLLCEDCAPEPRTPVVNSQWDPEKIAGVLTGPDMDGYYTITAEDRGTDWALVIMDIDDRQFKLTDVSYTATPSCQVLYDHPTMIYIGCPSTIIYVDQVVTEFWSTWPPASGVQSVQFKMVAP